MKKYILLSGLFLLANSMLAEEMTFITTLSAPVGSFRQVDVNTQAEAGTVVFYKPNIKVTLRGTEASFRNMKLGGGKLTGDQVTRFHARFLRAAQNGTISGKGLLANQLVVESTSQGVVGGTLYSDADITAQRAKVDHLQIEGVSKIKKEDYTTTPGDSLKWCANELGTSDADKANQIFLTDVCPDKQGKTCAALAMEECGIDNWSRDTAQTVGTVRNWGKWKMLCTKKNQEELAKAPAAWQNGSRRYFWDFRENAAGECKVVCRLDDALNSRGVYEYMSYVDSSFYTTQVKPIYEYRYNNQTSGYEKVQLLSWGLYAEECYVDTNCPVGYERMRPVYYGGYLSGVATENDVECSKL